MLKEWLPTLWSRADKKELTQTLEEKMEQANALKEQATEVVDAVASFPFVGVLTYGIFFILMVFAALVIIFLLVMILKK